MAKEIKGAELLAAGTWNGTPFTTKDIDSMVSAFDLLDHKGRVPLKFGHDADHKSDGQPAFGWVEKLWRDGEKLMADLSGIPDRVYELVRDGMYKYVSIEALKNVKASTGVIPWVLDAVALLGADKPAVGVLSDLQGLTLKRRPVLLAGARVSFSRESRFSVLEDDDMTPEEVQALIDKANAPFKAELAATKVQLTASDERAAKAETNLHKFTVDAKRNGIKAALETAVKADELAPAKRDMFFKMTRIDNDAAVMEIKDEDVVAYLKDNYQKPKAKIVQGGEGDTGDKEPDEVQAKIKFRAEKLATSRGIKHTDFVQMTRVIGDVLRADDKLSTEYRAAIATGMTAAG